MLKNQQSKGWLGGISTRVKAFIRDVRSFVKKFVGFKRYIMLLILILLTLAGILIFGNLIILRCLRIIANISLIILRLLRIIANWLIRLTMPNSVRQLRPIKYIGGLRKIAPVRVLREIVPRRGFIRFIRSIIHKFRPF